MTSAQTQKRQNELIILQSKHSEYLYRKENEIHDKIEQEQFVTSEEWKLFLTLKIQHLLDAIEGRA